MFSTFKPSQVIRTRSSDTAGGPSASPSLWSVQKNIHQTCFSPGKLEKSDFFPHILFGLFGGDPSFLCGMTLNVFFREPKSPKSAELFFGFQGFPDHVEAGTSLSYVPPLQQPMGAPSSVHLGMKQKKKSMWDMGKFCGSCVFVWRKG